MIKVFVVESLLKIEESAAGRPPDSGIIDVSEVLVGAKRPDDDEGERRYKYPSMPKDKTVGETVLVDRKNRREGWK